MSAKKPISQKRTEREQQENQALNRVFAVFLLGLAAECYLFILYRAAVGSVGSMLACYRALGWIAWIGLAMLAAGAAVAYVKRKDSKIRVPMTWLACAGLFLGATGWIMRRFSNDNQGIIAMCIMVPIAAVLALIFLLYQRECFLCSLALTGSLLAVWLRGASLHSGTWRIPVMAGMVLAAAVLGAAAFLTRKAQENEGKMWGIRFFSLECDYRVVYGVLAAGFVCVLLALAVASLGYYLMWALGVVLFAALVYYTSKLM